LAGAPPAVVTLAVVVVVVLADATLARHPEAGEGEDSAEASTHMAAYDDGFEGVITGDEGGGAGDSLTAEDVGLTARGDAGGVLLTSFDEPVPAIVAKDAFGVAGRMVAGSDFHGLVGGAVRLAVGVAGEALVAARGLRPDARGLTPVLDSGEGSREALTDPAGNPGGGVGRRIERILSCEW
jgi:hypothetical protein